MKIGFIGLGIMGESMCENIIKKHDDKVFVFDFVKPQVDKMAALGAVACANSTEVAQNADIIISMVPKSEHSRSVYEEVSKVTDSSKICIDMSTIDPSVSVEISKMIKSTGAQFADAPVVKSKPAAIAGKLGIYVGCDESLYETIKPILLYMGENVIRMGDNGKGLVMKICHNALVSQIQNGVNETSTLAAKNGIDILTFAQAISYGGGQNFYLDSKKDVISRNDFTTAFSVENEHKDIGICMKLAEESGLKMPGEENAKRVYDEAMAAGYGKEDFSATIKIVRGDK
ncbi:MAG: NAD(P)-dependent oxidoreductase [Treponema sp.]|nr:NAD(P)-dependent oxidoreductase [Treponema sp.]MDY5123214.1 NAD(P)-dependent oxidoreductase [Treponema sp.]